MNSTEFNRGLFEFLSRATTPFHAVAAMTTALDDAGFESLDEIGPCWETRPGGRYYLTRNDSSLVAFTHGSHHAPREGLHMVGAHTDSPCLMVKPNPERLRKGCFQLGVEVYGGALLNPWFDRDLSLAGRVSYADDHDQLATGLVDFRTPLAIIPSLAIHLDREANSNRSVNPQTDILPCWASRVRVRNRHCGISSPERFATTDTRWPGCWITNCAFTMYSRRRWWG